ncbi:FUSC family protein [Rhodanobacter lindaniclasticus]
MAVCLSATLALSRWLHLPHGYWLPMTAAIVLRADFAATFNFGLLRVLGTVLGLVLTTLLLYVTPDQPWAHLALMAVLCMAFRYLAGAHYGVAVALTGTVVILLSFEGVAPDAAVLDRVINTALGCGIALLAGLRGLADLGAQPRTRRAGQHARRLRRLSGPPRLMRRRGAWRVPFGRPHGPHQCAGVDRAHAQRTGHAARAAGAGAPTAGQRQPPGATAMTLEAMLDDLATLPPQTGLRAFIEEDTRALRAISTALRQQAPLAALPRPRAPQRALVRRAEGADAAIVDVLGRLSDRLVDNVYMLATW